MKLDKKVDVEHLVELTKGYSGAEIQALCTEAGYGAIRKNRHKVKHDDFIDAHSRILAEKEEEESTPVGMFG